MIKIAIIGAGMMAKIFADRAKELNIETYCFAWEKGSIAKGSVDHFYDINIFDKEKILDICQANNINGVLATTELTIKIVAYITNKMQLNGNSIELSEKITNKGWVREQIQNSHSDFIYQPEFHYIRKRADKIEEDNFPVIVKPVSFGGKHGITVVNKKEDLDKAVDYAFESIENRNNDGIIIEHFLDGGQEYSVESLSFHKQHSIIQITQKDSSGAPHCVELGHHQPAELSNEMWSKVENSIKKLLDCIGYENGPCHTEIKIIDNKIYLIEINARPGGDFISYPLTELSTGYKFITGIIFNACNIFYNPEVYKGEKMYAGVYFVTKLTPYLKDVFDTCDNKPWLYNKNKVSEELQEITHNDSYHINSFMYYSKEMPKELKDIKNVK